MLQARSQKVTQKLQTDFVVIAVPYLTMTTADDDAR
jgi:archaellum component FlaG (FlaF/FlaG flagellin family)